MLIPGRTEDPFGVFPDSAIVSPTVPSDGTNQGAIRARQRFSGVQLFRTRLLAIDSNVIGPGRRPIGNKKVIEQLSSYETCKLAISTTPIPQSRETALRLGKR